MQDVNNYSTARIYTKSLAKARLLAKDSSKSQIKILEEAINLLWNEKMNKGDLDIDIIDHLPEHIPLKRGIENAISDSSKNSIK